MVADSEAGLYSTTGPSRARLWTEFAIVMMLAYVPAIIGQVSARFGGPVATDAVNPAAPFTTAVAEAGRLAAILLIVWLADGSLRAIGFQKPRWIKDALMAGVLILLARFFDILILHWLPKSLFQPFMGLRLQRHGASMLQSFSPWATLPYVILSSITQEVLLRGYAISRLRQLLSSEWGAVLVSALAFAAWHSYQGPQAVLSNLAFGLAFGVYFAATGRLGACLVAHSAYNCWLIVHNYVLAKHR